MFRSLERKRPSVDALLECFTMRSSSTCFESWLLCLALLCVLTTCTSRSVETFNSIVQRSSAKWLPCPVFTPGFWNSSIVPADAKAECANLSLPLRWKTALEHRPFSFASKEPPANISIFVKRVYNATTAARIEGHLYLLEGGPGGSGINLEPTVLTLMEKKWLGKELDFILVDHRGTGRSELLTCPNASSLNGPTGNFSACVEYLNESIGLDALKEFSTTNAAMDVLATIHIVNTTTKSALPNYIYGLSYGTYWAARLIQVAGDWAPPSALTSVVLDSFAVPGVPFTTYDDGVSTSVANLFDTCAQLSPSCKAKLTDFPINVVAETYKHFGDAPSLPCLTLTNVSKIELQQLGWLFGQQTDMRLLLPPLFLRLFRCNAEDQQQLSFFFRVLANLTSVSKPQVLLSSVLQWNIILSEMLTQGLVPLPSATQAFYHSDALYFASYIPALAAKVSPLWPKYSLDPYVGRLPNASLPILLLSGELDPETNQGDSLWAASRFLQASSQGFVSIPYGPHGVLLTQASNSEVPCGVQIMSSFLEAGEHGFAQVNTTCVRYLLPPDFEGKLNTTQLLSMQYFGTASFWTG